MSGKKQYQCNDTTRVPHSGLGALPRGAPTSSSREATAISALAARREREEAWC